LGEIQKIWFREAKEAVKDLREDYMFPIFV
jgi:hypothetical protein